MNAIFLIVAAICFGIKALSVDTGRIDMMNLGFMFVTISLIV